MSAAVRTGLVLLGVLSLVDVAGILLTDGETPPVWIAVTGTVLGVLSLVLLWFGRRGERGPLIGLLAVRLLSAATAVPAFVIPDVPVGLVGYAAAFVVLTLVGCGLVVPALRRTGADAR